MPKFKVSTAAVEDLINIGQYTENNWGIKQRNIYLDEISKKFSELANHPDSPTIIDRSELREGCFSSKINSHIIIFRKFDYGIRIVRVLHQSMGFKRHF